MNFSYRDMLILVSMSTAVILMTFTFTALGLADETVSENDIPEYNTTDDNFNFVGQFPENPHTPSNFIMTWEEKLQGDSNNQMWLDGDTSSGTELVLLNNGNESNLEPEMKMNVWDSGNVTQYSGTYNEVGDYHVFNENGYEIYTAFDSYRNKNQRDMVMNIDVEIRSQPGDSDYLRRIPVIGGLISGTEYVASAVLWIGSIFYWTLGTIFEIILNLTAMLYGSMAFFISFMHWIITAYTAVISGASAWASVFVAIPGILLMVEFAKLILIGIKLLPST